MVSESTEKSEHLVDQQPYLERLIQADRTNLESLKAALDEVLKEKGSRGILKAVGGTINKPLPRKDLDLTLKFDEKVTDPKRDDFPDYLQYSLASYNIFRNLVKEAVSKCDGWEIEEEIQPAMEEEHQNPAILKNDGSIKIKPREGTTIEIIRKPPHAERIENEPYVILKAA